MELSVVVPTFNERRNIETLISALEPILDGLDWEVIFVDDDSDDLTSDCVKKLAEEKLNVRCLHRIGRRGLSSACIEGILSSSAPNVAVMDADLQHDEKLLPKMLSLLQENPELDIVVGSRYMPGGSTGSLAQHRVKISQFAGWLSRLILKKPLSDPMSGFFMIRRSVFDKHVRELSSKGFKILLDIFSVAGDDIQHQELAYDMRSRVEGESKLDSLIVWEYLLLVLDRYFGQYVPVRFILFVIVGSSGVLIHLLFLSLFYNWLAISFIASQSIATWIAMSSNFILNNRFTYRDRRLVGKQILRGLVSFYIACSLGALVNVITADYLFSFSVPWWVAGVIGAAIGSVWNYSVTSIYTWSKPKAQS
jgi:dolichol-phosphate mannosyltransferase